MRDESILRDQDARDLIETDLHSTLFVEAGAGSGKTTALVARLVALVRSGVPVQSIAAITFTEAAAAELKDRVRGTLEKLVEEKTPAGAAWAVAALDGLDSAAIQTIHGFAQRILALHPLQAGLPPRFEIRDEVQASIAFDERWDEIVDDLLSDPAIADHIVAVLAFGLTLDGLREIGKDLHQNWDRLQPGEEPLAPLSVELSGLRDAYRELAARRHECSDPADKFAEYLERIEAHANRLEVSGGLPDRIRALGRVPGGRWNVGQQKNWPDLPALREELKGLLDRQRAMARATAEVALGTVVARIARHIAAYADERLRDGVVEFHDLLVRARDLVCADAAVRGELGQRFTRILVDEFQDTDPLQVEIVQAIANGAGDPNAKPPDGRLFFVGDPKQSIYRFRRADIALYQRTRDELGARPVSLTTNFRSQASILNWVNHVFLQVMGETEEAGRPAYVPLDPRPGVVTGEAPSVHLFGAPGATSASDARDAEALDLARAVRTVRVERWPVVRDNEPARPARYQDIAILVPTRTNLPAIENALEEMAVPYRVESRSLLFKTQEVRDLISILAAIDDPADQVALVAALRSPAFACGDDDLLAYANAGGRWDYLSTPPPRLPADHPVVSAMVSLAGWHRGRWWLSIGEIVDGVIRDRRLFELAFAHSRPQERWQRYRFVQGHARAFAGQPGTSLRRFVAWLRRQAEEGAMVAESPVPDPDDDAVRIMTVHAAKGLEFPVVCLVGLGVRPLDRRGKVLWSHDGRPIARISEQLESEAFASLAGHHKEMEAYETHRLLYVAATRARDHLIVGLHSPERSGATPAQLIHEAAQADPALWSPFAFPDGLSPDSPAPPEPFGDSPEQRAAWLAELAAIRRRAGRPASVAATAIARAAQEALVEAIDEEPEPSEGDASWRRGRAGTSVGRAVHAVLQGIDLATGEGLAEAAIAQASAEGIPGRQQEITRLAGAALAAPSVREAVSSGRFWRELFVGVPVGEQLLEGFIDLLYELPGGGLVVVDYKTDEVRDEAEVEEKLARYRLQGAAYALALERSLGRSVTSCRFVFLSPSGAIEREAGDLRTAIAEVEAFLSTPAS